MANYLTTTSELTSVADAIRTKGGTVATLTYPTGFVSAIGAISTGGGSEVAATAYANNSGNKVAVQLDNNGGYNENWSSDDPSGQGDLGAYIESYSGTMGYGMVADSSGNVAWKGAILDTSIGGLSGTDNYSIWAGGYMLIEMDETQEDFDGDIVTTYTISVSSTPTTNTYIYLSTTAF